MFKLYTPRTVVISIGLVIALFIFSFFFFTANFKPVYYKEQILHKNKIFTPKPGDVLIYEYNILNESGNISFLFWRKVIENRNFTVIYANCTTVTIAGSNISTCINANGTDEESNQSLNSGFFFFAPWMLALSDNFNWKSQVVNSISHEPLENFSVLYIKKTIFLGRDAYVAKVESNGIFGNIEKKIWIDVQNRIVLKEEGKNYTFKLIRAWFPLSEINQTVFSQPQLE